MSIITLFSRHISKKDIPNGGADIISADIVRFCRMKHKAAALAVANPDSVDKKKKAGPDLRKKENRDLRKEAEPSTHMKLKKDFQVNDYFANSANNEAKDAIRSVKELRKNHTEELEDSLSQVKEKLKKEKKRLNELNKTKDCLIARSKWKKRMDAYVQTGKGKKPRQPKLRMPKGGCEVACPDQTFKIFHFNPRTCERKEVNSFKDAYCFETQYLDPLISSKKNLIHSLEGKISKLERRIKEEASAHSVCFGSKKLFKKQETVYTDHKVWLQAFRKKRYHQISVSGRKDSINGNYVFRYDPEEYSLLYRSMNGTEVCIPDVKFLYQQKLLESYLLYQKNNKVCPIQWTIEDCGGSFLIKCSFERDYASKDNPVRLNDYYQDGCIGLDANVDRFAVSETDASGNLVSHTVIPFNLKGLSSGQVEQILSTKLDEVFKICQETKKPLAAEALYDVASKKLYGNKALNRVLSSFPHEKIRQLLLSKSWKNSIAVTFVNPAYTSQIGKMKYMGKYGISVHESAGLVIARRAMGFRERIPKGLKDSVPEEKKLRHHWAHWASVFAITKQVKPHTMYEARHTLRLTAVRKQKPVTVA